jgi:hypothetical protein
MKRNIVIAGAVLALLLLLGGAAYVGGQLLNGQGLPANAPGGPSGLHLKSGNGQETSLDIEPSKELPQTPADVRGLFNHRQDKSIFVGTGKVTLSAKKDPSGNVETSSSNSGPTVEVIVTNQTIVYHDVTLEQFNGPPPSGQKLQQVLEPGSLDEIGDSSLVTVWGKQTDTRTIADVLVYTSPAFIKK